MAAQCWPKRTDFFPRRGVINRNLNPRKHICSSCFGPHIHSSPKRVIAISTAEQQEADELAFGRSRLVSSDSPAIHWAGIFHVYGRDCDPDPPTDACEREGVLPIAGIPLSLPGGRGRPMRGTSATSPASSSIRSPLRPPPPADPPAEGRPGTRHVQKSVHS